LRAANIGSWGIDVLDVLEMDFTQVEEDKFACQIGDVLLVEGGNEKSVGCPAIVSEIEQGLCIQNTVIRCRSKDSDALLPEYLYQFLAAQFLRGVFGELCTGTTIKHLGQKRAFVLPVLLPPPLEQRRIVDVVESVDNYIAAQQERLDAARVAHNALLYELLNAGGDGWVETTLGDVASEFRSRTKVFPDKVYPAAGVMKEGRGLLDREPFIGGKTTYKNLTQIKGGQLVLRSITAWEAPIAVVSAEFSGRFVSGVFPVFDLDAKRILPSFMGLVCTNTTFWNEMRERCVGSVLRRKVLGAKALLEISINLPPLVEQRRIVEIVSSMDDSIRATEQTIVEAKNLRSGLLSDLFSGEHEIPTSYDKLLGAA